MDRPQQVYKMCPPKINKETDQSERIDITSQMRLKLCNPLHFAKEL